MTILWGRETGKGEGSGNGESRDNRRSFDFAQDDTFFGDGDGYATPMVNRRFLRCAAE
jgi:hypothetical protein